MTDEEPKIAKKVWVTGRVQGVGFRNAVFSESRKWKDLTGYVRNLPDGRVEALFQGSELSVNAMIEFCHDGPAEAEVQAVDVDEQVVDLKIDIFEITY